MKLDRVHQISEIVASVAIVASLIFVGLQVNQNTHALRNAAAQANTESWQNINLTLANNPDLAELLLANMRMPEDLPFTLSKEHIQASAYIGANIKSMESNYHQWRSGNLSDELFEAARAGLAQQIRVQPYFEMFMRSVAMSTYTESFQAFVKELLAELEAKRAAEN